MFSGSPLLFAFVGGFMPALLWLWFWLKEDGANPEPGRFIMLAFLAGMISVPIVIPLEKLALYVSTGGLTIVLWAAIEEIVKYSLGLFLVLKRKVNDEPIDAVIYMITIALGFAALENTLFLLEPLLSGKIPDAILTGNLRFLGATLLHTLASAVVGVSMAFAFFKSKNVKRLATVFGLFLAIVLHSMFNFFIISGSKANGNILEIFFFVWVGIVALIYLFEKVKKFNNRDLIYN